MIRVYMAENNAIKEIPLSEAFPFLKEGKHVISFVGAGGKTTLLYALANEAALLGRKTIVTTTTHIWKPTHQSWSESLEGLEIDWEKQKYRIWGKETSYGKLKCPEDIEKNLNLKKADLIFIEADGAKEKPCKVPAKNEPVIVSDCDLVLGVIGMDAVGRPIKDVCFRLKETLLLLEKKEEDILSEEDVVKILVSPNGTRKNAGDREYIVILNKCDHDSELQMAGRIQKKLLAYGIKKIYFTKKD